MSARDLIAECACRPDWNKLDVADYTIKRLTAAGYRLIGPTKFAIGQHVTKIKGSSWTGKVVGFYSTSLTPMGYAVESENEPGSVQIYPEAALRSLQGGEDGH